jgi:SAM-dependent methyltransferase
MDEAIVKDPFWEQPDVVEQFAAREPDHRLLELLDRCERPEATRVLDLGCAGGRNTLPLARRGFDVWAMDASAAMVERTRERLEPVLGAEAARERVRCGAMHDLTNFADESFDLVVALGIYHNARSREEWEVALGETVRVLKPGGRLLVNHFTPEVDLTGEGVRPVAGEPDVFDGFPGGRTVLLYQRDLDAALALHGMLPEVPSQTVRGRSERGWRVSVNGLYGKKRVGVPESSGGNEKRP